MRSVKASHYVYTSHLTRKGQVTIPVEIRRGLGLRQGDTVAFVQDGDAVTLVLAQSIAERTACALAQYRRVPAPSAREEREAFAQAVADEVAESLPE